MDVNERMLHFWKENPLVYIQRPGLLLDVQVLHQGGFERERKHDGVIEKKSTTSHSIADQTVSLKIAGLIDWCLPPVTG